MQIYSYYPNQYISSRSYTKDSTTTANTDSETTSQLSPSNTSATLELTADQQMEMKAYEPYSVASVTNTYKTATTSTQTSDEIYNAWFEKLGQDADARLNNSYDLITTQKATTEGLTTDFINQLSADQINWFLNQRDNLLNQLATNDPPASELELSYYANKADQLTGVVKEETLYLGVMDEDMWQALENFMSTGEKATFSFADSLTNFANNESQLNTGISDYLTDFQQEMDNRTQMISQEEIQNYTSQFDQWASDLEASLISNISDSTTPLNTKKLFLDDMQDNFDIIMPEIRNIIIDSIHQKNNEIEEKNRQIQQAYEAKQFDRFNVDYKIGSGQNEVRITTSTPSSSDYSTKFLVEDNNGRSKNVYVSFKDENLKKAFDEKIKEAGLEGKKISSKKFNEIMRELKRSLDDLSDVDLDALLRKMKKGEKDLDFEQSMNRFILYLKRAIK